MKTIYKYQLKELSQCIALPKGAEVLCVQVQPASGPCIWALVDTKAPTEERYFNTFETGEELGDNGYARTYIGTYQTLGYVYHVFEIILNNKR